MGTGKQNETIYQPTLGEKKLLEVLLNPENRHDKIEALCSKAEVDRSTYYRAFNKIGFVDLYKTMSKNLVLKAVGPLINTFIKQGLGGSFQHGKVILEMAEMYTEKQQTELTGSGGGPVVFVNEGKLED